MITETVLMDIEDLPPEMASRLDRPWEFLGEVSDNIWMARQCACLRCIPDVDLITNHDSVPSQTFMTVIILSYYPVVTADMLHIGVYFGVCEQCDQVFWMREAPPYEMARHYSTVGGDW